VRALKYETDTKAPNMHLTLEHYLLVLQKRLPATTLLRQAHSHVVEVCDLCATEWDGGDGAQPVPLPYVALAAPDPHEHNVPETWLITQEQVDRC